MNRRMFILKIRKIANVVVRGGAYFACTCIIVYIFLFTYAWICSYTSSQKEYSDLLSKCSAMISEPVVVFEYSTDSSSNLIIAVDKMNEKIIIGDIGCKTIIRGMDLGLPAYTDVCSYAVIDTDGIVLDMQLETNSSNRFPVWKGNIKEFTPIDMHLDFGTHTIGLIETGILHVQFLSNESVPGETVFSYEWHDGVFVVWREA